MQEFQQEIVKCKSRIVDMEKQLRIFEGDASEITALDQAEYHEHILEETLKQVRLQKQVLQEKYNSPGPAPTTQVHLPSETPDVSGFLTGSSSNGILDWMAPQRDPQIQILNFLDSNGLLPPSDQTQTVAEILPPPSPQPTLLHGEEINVEEQLSPRSSGLESDNNVQRPEFGQIIDVNMSPWTQLYPTVAGNDPFPDGQPLLELYLSQFAQSAMSTMNQHHT
ncbi:MADS-box transcription factor 3 [Corchorus capsularis]|uniref:MADS-box transcription factor 3 n=1 Tax=Corchorus capsularis TaxID=210143 RepID=A0A1R3I8L5_COCAP|nr:MADS-box transcription factor 3 [Corchorus capsularis]